MKSFSLTLKKAVSLFVLAFAFVAHAETFPDSYETVNLYVSPFYLSEGETRTVSLGGDWRYVQKVYIQASGVNSSASTFQVWANGDAKGTIYVPGRDPSYIVTIGEAASSIQLQHISGGSAYIKSITVVRSCRPLANVNPPPVKPPHYPDYLVYERNEASSLARVAIKIVDQLQPYANYDEFGTYLLPIKKAAARAYAAAQAKGSVSLTVHQYLEVLKAQIDYATPYVEETFERSAVFELSIELKSLGERLDTLLR